MTTWFTSDHHFYHNNVVRYCNRPYKTVEEMNADLVKRWNDKVAPDDIVYHLGDFSMAFRPVELFTQHLNGIKYLIAGNHDFCHPVHKKARTPEKRAIMTARYIDNGWAAVDIQMELTLAGGEFVKLCHLPYREEGAEYDQRFLSQRPVDRGEWLLCGHVHEKWKIKRKMINVGVDVWDFAPVSETEISELIRKYS